MGEAERALRSHDFAAARSHFSAAGDTATKYGLWRAASRCYRRGLELDLTDRSIVERLARLAKQLPNGRDWLDYVVRLDRSPWPKFGCRGAQVVIGDAGTVVTCPDVGVVLELMMSANDLVEVHPDGRFATEVRSMPRAMGFVILRRAMWHAPREQTSDPSTVRVLFAGTAVVTLDELGDWS